ncbi:MAG: Hpt domain-containing protein [Azoarcus sp.]|jgi:chemosensory pili system protein ChpA (sensor histidine kinase/response regulator)|nr:Hpt domain-containing protein [Azoarcus sp.]
MTQANEPDLGPLTWVKGEIDQALSQATDSLKSAGEAGADGPAKVQFAQTHLHQAHGALSIIGLDGLTKFVAALDLFLGALARGELPVDKDRLELGRRGLASIGNYLSELVHGAPDQPLRLLPLYRELVNARGETAPFPADLFFPDLSVRIPRRADAPELDAEQRQIQHRTMLKRFQRGFVDWIKQPDASVHTDTMRSALAGFEASEDTPGLRALWWAGQAFIDTLVSIPADELPATKHLLNRLENQLRHVSSSPQAVPERLLRELLYEIASRPATTPIQQAARQAWQLDALMPEADVTVSDLPLAPLLQELHSRLTKIKEEWNTFGEQGATALPEFTAKLEEFTKSIAPLGRPVLHRLLNGMSRFVVWLSSNPQRYSEPIALEFATALLLAESVLDRSVPDPGFQHQVGDALARLEALARGEEVSTTPSSAGVESARKRQEKEAQAQLSHEILSSLATIEQTLDDFFRDHAKRAPLATLEAPLHKIEGALAVLGETDAIALIREAGKTIATLAQEDAPVDETDLNELARRFSALGFFIQSLQYSRTSVAQYLSPDKAAAQPREARFDLPALLDIPALQARKTEAAAPAFSADGIESFPTFEIDVEGTPVIAAEEKPPTPIPPITAETQRLAEAPKEELDAELLSIFIEEAHEVLDKASADLEFLRNEPDNLDHLTEIRRGFHTLKGSGRMVGLSDLGEAAWGMEQTYNRWLKLEWQVTPDLLQLTVDACREFTAWVKQIKDEGEYQRDVAALLASAEHLRNSGGSGSDEELPAALQAPAVPPAAKTPPSPPAAPAVEFDLHPEPATRTLLDVPDIQLEPATETALDVPDIQFDLGDAGGGGDFSRTQIVPEKVDIDLEDVHLIELDEPETVETDLTPEIDIEIVPEDIEIVPEPPYTQTASAQTETAKETERKLPSVPEFQPFDFEPFDFTAQETAQTAPEKEPAHEEPVGEKIVAEAVAEPIASPEMTPESTSFSEPESAPDADTLHIGEVEISRPLFELYVAEAQMHIATLHQEFDHLGANPTLSLPETSLRAAHSCTGISGTARCTPLFTLGRALEHAQQRIYDQKRPPNSEELDLFKTSADTLDAMLTEVIGLNMPLETPELVDLLDRIGHPVEISNAPLTDDTIAQAVAHVVSETSAASKAARAQAAPEAPPVLNDEIDEQLLPIFLEEAEGLLTGLHNSLRVWHDDNANPEHSQLIKRQLHTLKGSARMAGAMALGNQIHQLESRVESALVDEQQDIAALIDEIASELDVTEQLIATLNGGPAPAVEAIEVSEPGAALSQTASSEPAEFFRLPAARLPGETPRAAPITTISAPAESEVVSAALRVRAELVDNFVNDASEIGVARTRIEGELRQLRRSMLDLTENVIRLRNQLREIELQADVQMQTRMAQAESVHVEFDPLEMDRYTRLQELTRMMAESVNDVTTVQQNLLRNLDSADFALHSQARTTRELQQALMQVRMVPFDSLAVRLYRIVRQSAKELGKRANLDMRGGGIEIDRSVLEHIVAPLEHLLRNALSHGIETPEVRRANGKPELGQITLTTRQEGNEIVIELADDGEGLDFARIAERAREHGLLGPDETADERRLANLIFVPGFSTAKVVTAVSGRGVGMDVVKAETAAVGGRVDISTTPGAGTMFSIFLPLTLAVTQALLVRSGSSHYAIPASMISQVMELKADAVEHMRREGSYEWMGQQYGYYYLPNLLGDGAARPEIGRYSWVLLLHSGTQALALHVDALHGHQEIIVKNAGPQLTHIAGMSGATVLGNGEIVLIINPVAMVSREIIYGQAQKASETTDSRVPQPAPTHEPTVMVVDDSLTVRKITSRLLEREGYRVITAKDGVDAIESLIDDIPDVILSDIEMPRMDGFDFVRNIRADKRLKSVPVIMITSRLADKHREYAMEIGANHYLGKPYQEEELLSLIANYTHHA